ncbi:hypothetical protein [Cohnella rhizosphaerae]|uniref:Uncharacterized protein n=1 Tax=Cohnella rhizosphaerae TaxID=1457232 RepID=A0A9X4KXY7_9BACL|nr:hypothetical protein [Cohnella rhizosphaerae]MDG0813364.1 hypothetical protein [Cohnella rhizosphaerae]
MRAAVDAAVSRVDQHVGGRQRMPRDGTACDRRRKARVRSLGIDGGKRERAMSCHEAY